MERVVKVMDIDGVAFSNTIRFYKDLFKKDELEMVS